MVRVVGADEEDGRGERGELRGILIRSVSDADVKMKRWEE